MIFIDKIPGTSRTIDQDVKKTAAIHCVVE